MDLSIYIGNKIKYYRGLNKLTQTELGKKVGVGKGTISHYENGIRTPDQDKLFELADIFGISIDNLFPPRKDRGILSLYNKLEPPRQTRVYSFAESQLKEQNKIITIEETQTVYLNSKLSAGTGIIDLDPSDTEEIEFTGYIPKHDLAFAVAGDSMYPAFEDGEIVFVEKTPDVYNGQFIAVQINESAYLKKVYIEEDGLRLVSLNKEYDDIIANGDDDIRVIGRVIL